MGKTFKKTSSPYSCSSCGTGYLKWQGCCDACGLWNSLSKEQVQGQMTIKNVACLIEGKDIVEQGYLKTGLNEIDNVLGGGIVEGSKILLSGEPGVGKSTLALQLAGSISRFNKLKNILYVSGEESLKKLTMRATRLSIKENNLYVLSESDPNNIIENIKELKPLIVIIDSLQSLDSVEFNQSTTGVKSTNDSILSIIHETKSLDPSFILIGQINKDGKIAGVKSFEHLVDVILMMEQSSMENERHLQPIKNRFGSTNIYEIFAMSPSGLTTTSYELAEYIKDSLIGRAKSCLLNNSKCIPIIIESMIVEGLSQSTVRKSVGYDLKRLSQVLAIIDKELGICLSRYDIYINVLGKNKLINKEMDLAVIVSLLSSYYRKKIPYNYAFVGEVSLTGEVSRINNVEMREKYLHKYNVDQLICTHNEKKKYSIKKVNRLLQDTFYT